MGNNVKISVDCICDLPRKMWNELNLSIMYFYIETEEGRFQDVCELNSECIIEYLNEGKEAKSSSASMEEYKAHFESIKKEHDGPIIHICIAKYVSDSYGSAIEAAKLIDDVYVVDSGHLSGGMSLMILVAAEMAAAGAGYELILKELEKMREKVCSSFIVNTTEHLYRNGKISKTVVKVSNILSLRPVLCLKDSRMVVSDICIGDIRSCAKTYIKKILKDPETIDSETVFLISAGCSFEFMEFVKEEVKKIVKWKKIIVNTASATVTSNCGPGTFGVLFARK